MEITSRDDGAVVVATVAGDIDGKSAARAQAELLGLLDVRPVLVLDVAQVGYMSSAGLRLLLLLYRQATARHGRVVLIGLSDEIKETMSMTGFLTFFTLAADLGEARRLIDKEQGL
jgi:anti-sigma B factor antagonist